MTFFFSINPELYALVILPLLIFLAGEHFGVTHLDAQGSRGTVKIILTLVNRTDVPRITEFVHGNFPHAFFSIEDVRYASEGVFRPKNTHSVSEILGSLSPWKKK